MQGNNLRSPINPNLNPTQIDSEEESTIDPELESDSENESIELSVELNNNENVEQSSVLVAPSRPIPLQRSISIRPTTFSRQPVQKYEPPKPKDVYFATELTLDMFNAESKDNSKFLRDDNFYFIGPSTYNSFMNIQWLTISHCSALFKNLKLNCKIQITASANVTFINCEFYRFTPQVECCVEIFASSKAKLIGCVVHGTVQNNPDLSKGVGIACRDRSTLTCINCLIYSANTGLLIINDGMLNVDSCEFISEDQTYQFGRFHIYGYKNATINVKDSTFNKFFGKSLFMLDHTKLFVSNIKSFDNNGCISIANCSVAFIENAKVFNTKTSAFHAMKFSTLNVIDSFVNKSEGNCINYEYSTGVCYKCQFIDSKFPTMIAVGFASNPIVKDCIFKNLEISTIVIRQAARPKIIDTTLIGCKTHAVRVTHYSHPEFINIEFKDCGNPLFYIEHKSVMTIKNNNLFLTEQPILDNRFKIDSNCLLFYNNAHNQVIDQFIAENTFSDYIPTEIQGLCNCNMCCGHFITENHEPKSKQYISYNYYKTIEPITKISCNQQLFELIGTKPLAKLNPTTFPFWSHSVFKYPIFKQKEDDLYKCSCCKLLFDIMTPDLHVMHPCGHLICPNCRNNKTPTHCPKCSLPVGKFVKIYAQREDCCICWSMKATTFYLPCCHVCMCYSCAVNNLNNKKVCPICQTSAAGIYELPTVNYISMFDNGSNQ